MYKKIIILFTLIFIALSAPLFAATGETRTTEIYTTEDVPGGNCICISEGADGTIETDSTGKKCENITTRKYKCTVPSGLSGFQAVIATLIRWLVYIVMLLGVLGIVGLGIAWSFAGGDDVKMKTNLKNWGINILVGLIILFLFRYILQFLAPWIYQ